MYLLLLGFMVDVDRSLVSKTIGSLVNHYGSSFVQLLDEFPLESIPFGPEVYMDISHLKKIVTNHN